MSGERELRDRLPPQSMEAERAVLGSMLRDNQVISDILPVLHKDDFYADAHQKVYEAISSLYDQAGKPVDLITLAEDLKQRGYIEDVGGYGYLSELWDAAPSAANAEYYAHIVRDKAQIRNLIHASTEILSEAYSQATPAEQLVGDAERKILEIAERGISNHLYTLDEAIRDTYDRIDRRTTGDGMSASGVSTGFSDLDELTAGLHDSELVIVAARPSVGKCLVAGSEIVLADGRVVTIEEVFRRRQARLLTLGEDWKLRWTEPSAFVDDGHKPVYRVTTRLGRQVEATASHPFLTLEGWRPLAGLRPGDKVAVPRALPVFGCERIRDAEVKLLGYLIGDGGLTDNCPEFTNSNPRLREDFAAAVREFGDVEAHEENASGPRTASLRVSASRERTVALRAAFAERIKAAVRSRFTTDLAFARALGVSPSLLSFWFRGQCVPGEDLFNRAAALLDCSPHDLAPEGWLVTAGKNLLTAWLRDLGLWGKGARDKFIPEVIFRLERDQVALFLNRLFATDGWATLLQAGNTQIGYATVSERLARQIQHLLLRFGIIASLRRRAVKYGPQRRTAWQLDITDRNAILTFAAEIGMFGKEEPLARVVEAARRKRYQTNRDLLPAGVWDRLDQRRGGEPWAALARRAGLGEQASLKVRRRCLSRDRLAKLAVALEDSTLSRLAASDVYWDTIVSTEPLGPQQVYDLTIPETHNFIANDICVHNTAFALNLVRHIIVHEKQPVFFVSLEQSRIELAERLLCSQSRVDSQRLRKGTLTAEDMEKLIEAGSTLREGQLFIDDSPSQGMLRIAANARRLKRRRGIRLVVIDYLQLIEPENRRDPRHEQVAQVSRRLKTLAKELEIPVIALAQVNRASEDRQDHRPRVSDLRESGSIEQDADTIFLLHRPDRYEPGQHEGVIEVIVGKQRSGPVGEITLAYRKQFMLYEDFKVGTPFDG